MAPEKGRFYSTVILVLFTLVVVTGLGSFRAEQLAVKVLGERVTQAVSLGGKGLNPEELQKMIQTQDPQDPYYQELRQHLGQVQKDHQLTALSLVSRDEKSLQWVYLSDSRSEQDPGHHPLGTKIKSASPAMEKTIRGKVVQGEYNGNRVSSYLAVKNSQGKTIAVLVGEADGTNLAGFLYQTTYIQLGIVLLSLILLIGILKATRRRL